MWVKRQKKPHRKLKYNGNKVLKEKIRENFDPLGSLFSELQQNNENRFC